MKQWGRAAMALTVAGALVGWAGSQTSDAPASSDTSPISQRSTTDMDGPTPESFEFGNSGSESTPTSTHAAALARVEVLGAEQTTSSQTTPTTATDSTTPSTATTSTALRPTAAPTSVPTTTTAPTTTITPTTPTTAAPPPRPTTTVPAVATPEARGAAALAKVSYDWIDRLPGWTITFGAGRSGVFGYTYVDEQRIEIFVRDDMSEGLLAHVVAHELGHAVDLSLNGGDDRDAWASARGIGGVQWWPGSGVTDFATGAGDFAEAFAVWQVGPSNYRGRAAGAPTQDQLAIIAALANR